MSLNENQQICNDCQFCCKYLILNVNYNDKESFDKHIEFLNTWGVVIMAYDDNRNIEMAVPLPCRHLTKDGCRIYEERPEICRRMDGSAKAAFYKRNCKLIAENHG